MYLYIYVQLETAVRGMGFSYVSLFRPGFLNRGPTDRWVEKLAGELFQLVDVVSSTMTLQVYFRSQSKGGFTHVHVHYMHNFPAYILREGR